jgi:hypothetical protein
LRQKHGVFVGNVWAAYVKDNIISAKKINNINTTGKVFSSPIAGIHVFGYHGKVVLVSGNSITGSDIGIKFRTLGYLPDDKVKDKPLRAITYNVVQHFTDAYDKSGSLEESRIKMVDNMPNP